MAFSTEWERRYQENTHISIWPWSDLVSYVMRYARPDHEGFRVLELGCGAGANIPFFQYLGVDYYAIEGSSAIVDRVCNKFPELKGKIVVGDFTKEIDFDLPFDLIVDRGALTHNTTAAIKNCLGMVYASLKQGGKMIGIDWFSFSHTEFKKGIQVEDQYTRSGYTDGQFAFVGNVHFSDENHLLDLFDQFTMEILEHKVINKQIPEDGQVFAAWNFVARKD